MSGSGFLYGFFTSVFDFYILHKFFGCFSSGKRVNGYLQIFLRVICALILSVVNLFKIPNANLVAICGLVYLYSFTFKYSKLYCVILPMLYIGLGFVTEPIGLLLVRSFTGLLPPDVAFYLAVSFCEIIRFLIIYIVCKGWNTKLPTISLHLNLLLFLIPIMSVVASCMAIYIAKIYDTPTGNRLCLAVVIIILLSNSMTFMIFHRLGILTLESERNILLLHETKAKEEYYQEVERNNRRVQEIKHDLKNRLLGAMAEEGGDLLRELESILKELEYIDKGMYTSNIIFNTILSSKLYINEYKLQIKIDTLIIIPKKMNLEYSDVGILLGNLLDNAVEACSRIVYLERWIKVVISYKNHMLVIKISNSKEKKPSVIRQSSKNHWRNHGFGLGSVKKIAEKYNGTSEFIDHGDWFESSVILYGIQDETELDIK